MCIRDRPYAIFGKTFPVELSIVTYDLLNKDAGYWHSAYYGGCSDEINKFENTKVAPDLKTTLSKAILRGGDSGSPIVEFKDDKLILVGITNGDGSIFSDFELKKEAENFISSIDYPGTLEKIESGHWTVKGYSARIILIKDNLDWINYQIKSLTKN